MSLPYCSSCYRVVIILGNTQQVDLIYLLQVVQSTSPSKTTKPLAERPSLHLEFSNAICWTSDSSRDPAELGLTCTLSEIRKSNQPVSILFFTNFSCSRSLMRYSTVVRKSPRMEISFRARTMFLENKPNKSAMLRSRNFSWTMALYQEIPINFWKTTQAN